jgi:predicted Fe-S protein YdhL (DUF1289 family)
MNEAVESPCIGICKIDPLTGLCCGCCRTLDEITNWQTMSPEEQQQVLNEIFGRD